MSLRPYTVARWGIYVALGFAGLSVWLGMNAGASLDFALLRAVFVFVLFTAIALGADAVLTLNVHLAPPPPAPKEQPDE